MANDIFTRAKAYRKKHPRTPWAECVKKCAGKKKVAKKKPAAKKKTVVRKKVATVGRAKKPAAKKTASRKLKIKIKPGKKGGGSVTIGSMKKFSIGSIESDLRHISSLEAQLEGQKQHLRSPNASAKEKSECKRTIKNIRSAIAITKKRITAHKKNI